MNRKLKILSIIIAVIILSALFGCGKEYKKSNSSETITDSLFSSGQLTSNSGENEDLNNDNDSSIEESNSVNSVVINQNSLTGKWKRVVSSEKKVISYLNIKSDGTFESSIETPNGNLLIETGKIKDYNKGKAGISEVKINDTARRIMGHHGDSHYIERSYNDYIDTLNIHKDDYLYCESVFKIADQLKVGDIVICEYSEFDGSNYDRIRKIAEIRPLTPEDYNYSEEYVNYEFYSFDKEYYEEYINNLTSDLGFVTSDISGNIKNERAKDIYSILGRYLGKIQNFSNTALYEYDETIINYSINSNKLTIGDYYVYDKC